MRNDIPTREFDVAVIGGGPAGMGAALSAREAGATVAIVERNEHLGGILRQCIHPGFGLTHFKEELTGPEYAQRFIDRVAETDIEVMLGCMVLAIDEEPGLDPSREDAGVDPAPWTPHTVTVMGESGIPGFGLTHFKEELTGPEYAQRFIDRVAETDIEVMLGCMVLAIDEEPGSAPSREDAHVAPAPWTPHTVTVMGESGMAVLACRSIVLAMGCRERTRSEIKIPGSRPAGVYTAGLAPRYINIENLRPCKRAVILGSGDLGLILARRCALEGIEVEGVYELMPYANGLHRNVKNCLEDFGIPLHLSTTVTRVIGRDRVEAVEVHPSGLRPDALQGGAHRPRLRAALPRPGGGNRHRGHARLHGARDR